MAGSSPYQTGEPDCLGLSWKLRAVLFVIRFVLVGFLGVLTIVFSAMFQCFNADYS